MHPPSSSDATPRGADLVHDLQARIEAVEQQLRALPVAADQKALKELGKTLDALSKRDEKFEERVSNRVDVVADRMETFARTVSTTSAALAAKDGDVAQLRRDLEAHAARVDAAVAQAGRGHDPAALDEVRRTVASLSEQKLPRGIEGRIEDLAAKLKLLTERVDTVSSTASTAAARLGGRDGELVALRDAQDADRTRLTGELESLRTTFDPRAIAELGQALSGLMRRASEIERTAQQSHLELGGSLESLAARLDALDTSLQAVVGRLHAGEGSVKALHSRLEDDSLRHASSLDGLEQSLRALAARVAAQEDLTSQSAREVDERLGGLAAEVGTIVSRFDPLSAAVTATSERLAAEVGTIVSRLDSLSAAVTATSEGLAQRDDGLERLRRELHERTARVDLLVGDLMRALADFPGDAVPELETRVQAIAETIERVAERFEEAERRREALVDEVARTASFADQERARTDELVARVDTLASGLDATGKALTERDEGLEHVREEVAEGRAGLDSLVADLTARLERAVRADDLETLRSELVERVEAVARDVASEDDRDRSAAELARLATVLEVDRAGTRSRLDALAAAIEGSSGTTATHELEEQLAALAGRFDTERAAVQGQLDALVDALAAPLLSDGGAQRAVLETRLDELVRRLEDVERRSAEVTSAVSKATTLWPTALRSLEARLDAIAPRAPAPDGGPTPAPPLQIPQEEHADEVGTADDPARHAPTPLGRWPAPLASGEP